MTALLKSIAKLPLTSTATGALNISFSQAQDPSTLHSLVTSFFELGGLHVGVSVFNREELLDATRHPENYPTLTVRMYGFSEYFVSLSPEQQDAVINRTLN
ncbi:MAG: hypothetical protein IJW03_01120 [Clostridia bacterium]|nr:hypothetical protein [Clostridia bacterium]